jgi:signal transduction histidine kinase/ActR/RegA family two-component response regulator
MNLSPIKMRIVFLIIIVIVILASCAEDYTLYETPSRVQSVSIQEADTSSLLIKGDWQYPPFEFLDGKGQASGFNVDVMKAIQEVLGLEMIIDLGPWHEVREELEDGRIHVLMGMFRTPERSRKVDFTIPHFIASYNLFVPRNSSIRKIEDARNVRILVQRGDLAHDYLLENGFEENLVLKDSVMEVIRGLADGEGACALASLTQGGIILDRYEIKSVKVIPEPVLTGSYCIAVRKGDTQLLAILNEGLNLIKINGEYDRIYEKWFGLIEEKRLLGSKVARLILISVGAVFLIGLTWTITLRRQVFQKTAALNRELARSREIQADLEKAVRAKTLFLANVSHELRTPVNGFLGMTALLRNTELSDLQAEYIDMADYSADYLLKLIDDLLDTARLENASLRLNIEEFSPREVIENCLMMLEKTAKEKGLQIFSQLPDRKILFSGDRTRTGQVVINLVSNAVKYSKTGTITIYARVDSELVLGVRDEGIGIPGEKLSSIFDSFRQLENPYTKTHQGAGLGLAIVKSLVGLMKGTLEVESVEGKGSTFTVRIPPARTVSPDGPEKSGDGEDPGEIEEKAGVGRILIVEDERINMLYLRRVLENAGYTVLEASNGQEAVETAIQEKPDLIFMDIGLPVMDGKEATRVLRSREDFTRVPVIALTAHSGSDEADEFIKAGGNDVIVKPFREFQILEAIKKRYAWTSNKHTV